MVRQGQTVLAKGYGLANGELSVPAAPETVYAIYSVTKRFTPVAHAALSPPEAGAFYQSLGALKSFRLIEQTTAGEQRTYRYRAVFGDTSTKWIQSFVLTDEGKIADVGVEPE